MTGLTVPQVVHTFRTKSTEGLSPTFLLLQWCASACFLAYGLLLPSYPIIVANASAGFGASLLVGAKLRWGGGAEAAA